MNVGGWIALIGNPLWTAGVHALLCRQNYCRRLPRQLVTAIAILATVALQTIGGLCFYGASSATGPIYIFFIALLSGHVYFHIFNMSETARRIRILLKLKQGKSVTISESYSSQEMIAVRLKRLVELKQVTEQAGVYNYRPSILLAVSIALKTYERLLFKRPV